MLKMHEDNSYQQLENIGIENDTHAFFVRLKHQERPYIVELYTSNTYKIWCSWKENINSIFS